MHDLIQPTRSDQFWSLGIPVITHTIAGFMCGLCIGGFSNLFFVFRRVSVPIEFFIGIALVCILLGIAAGLSEGMREYRAISRDMAHYNLLESYLGANPKVVRASKDGPTFVFV